MAAIERAGAIPHICEMTSLGSPTDLEQFAFDFETIGMTNLFPVWQIYRELREQGVVVSLDGHGADELLTGYPDQLREVIAQTGVLRSPVRAWSAARGISNMLGRGRRHAVSELVNHDPFLRRVQSAVNRGSGQSPIQAIDPRDPWVPQYTRHDDWMAGDDPARIEALSPLNRSLYRQFHHTTLPSILRKYDRLSMAHGIESRAPFALPESAKLGNDGTTKRILREEAKGILPEVVRNRNAKIGFQAPITSWMNGDVGTYVEEITDSKEFRESSAWNGPAIAEFVRQRNVARTWKPQDARRVWRYVQSHLWLKSFFGAYALSA
jgi:asparagine synthase (glutamine-hydrolysing)